MRPGSCPLGASNLAWGGRGSNTKHINIYNKSQNMQNAITRRDGSKGGRDDMETGVRKAFVSRVHLEWA